MNVTAKVDNDADVSDFIVLTIPPAILCAPPRANRVGGAARIHPHWAEMITEPAHTSIDVSDWGPGKVESVHAASAVTFHQRMGSFQGISVKTGEAFSGIGPHEQAHAEELEADPNIVTYKLQGLRAYWDDKSYLTDFHAHHVTDGVVAGEVKADASYFLNPKYAPTMANATRTFSAVDISFRKVDGTSLHANAIRRRNVRRAYCDRFTDVSNCVEMVANLLADREEVPLGEIWAHLANDPRTAQQKVHALLCRRLIAYDLNLPVHSGTIVSAATMPAEMIDISNIERSEAA